MLRTARRSSLWALGLSLSISFTTAYAAGLDAAHQAVSGDFNGDGRIDALLQPLLETGKGSILLQDGTGNLSVEAQGWNPGYLGLDWSTGKSLITTADLNGDGRDDVIVQPRSIGRNAAVLITDPTSQLLKVTQILVPKALGLDWSSTGHHLVPGDFDGDHQKELLLQAVQPGQGSAIVHADLNGRLVAVTQAIPDRYLGRRWNAEDVTLYVGDFNGDGRQDLLIQVNSGMSQPGESDYALLLADQNGQFTQLNQVWNDHDFGADWSPATHTLSVQTINGVTSIVLTSKDGTGINYLFEPNAQGQFDRPTVKWNGNKSAQEALKQQSSSTGSNGISVVVQPSGPKEAPTGNTMTANLVNGQAATVTAGNAPVAANATGEIAGSGGVNGSSASYSIPIALPPGRAGMQPSVSLSYSSRGGNGAVGMGWSLSAGSSIHRCPATQAQDGYTSGVTYVLPTNSSGDRLCLDGEHLILTSGTYGAVNSVYHTELENYAQVKLTGGNINSSAATFEVDYRNGHKSYYSYQEAPVNAPAALVWDITQEEDTAGNNILYTYTANYAPGEYHLAVINYTGRSDMSGNVSVTGNRTVKFTYTLRTDLSTSYLAGGKSQQKYILSSIDTYTGSSHIQSYGLSYAASPATDRSLLQSVQECSYDSSGNSYCFAPTTFNWQAPVPNFAEKNISYTDSSSGTNLLKIAPDYLGTGARQLVYTAGTNVSELLQFDTNFNVTALDVSSTSGSFGSGFVPQFSSASNATLSADTDLNSDGAADVIGIANGTVQFAESDHGDSALACNQPYTQPLGFACKQNTGIPYPSGSKAPAALGAFTGDYTGHGLNDLIVEKTEASGPNTDVILYTNQPGLTTIFNISGTILTTLNGTYDANNNPMYPYIAPAGDMDGNGLSDFFVSQSAPVASGGAQIGVLFLAYNSSGRLAANYVSFQTMGIATTGLEGPYWFMDINGDGLQDFVYVATANSGNYHYWYQINQGNQKFGSPVDTGVTASFINATGTGIFHGDVRNDGKEAILYPVTIEKQYCIPAPGSGGGSGSGGDICPVDQENNIYHYQAFNFIEGANDVYVPTSAPDYGLNLGLMAQPGDINGDGLTDFFYNVERNADQGAYNTGGCEIPVCSAYNGPNVSGETSAAPDLMIGVTDGYGAQSTWQYESLAQLLVSAKPGSSSTAPYYYADYPCNTALGAAASDYYCFSSSMYVVSDYQTSNGNGGMREYTYGYEDAVYNNKGRGFQGFRAIRINDLTAGLYTKDTYMQDFPYTGKPSESEIYVIGASTHFDDTTYTWNCSEINPAIVNGICNEDATGVTFWVYPNGSVATHSEWDTEDQIATTTSAYTYGSGDLQYGHTGSTSVSTTDASGTYTITTTPTYYEDMGAYCLDEVANSHVNIDDQYNTGSYILNSSYNIDHYKVFQYNSRCQVTDEWDEPPQPLPTAGQGVTAPLTQYTRYTHDDYDEGTSDNAYGNLVKVTVSGGSGATQVVSRATATSYTGDGYFVASVVNPALQTTSYSGITAAYGEPGTATAPDGVATTYTYDTFGRKSAETVGDMAGFNYTFASAYKECPANAVYSFWVYQPGNTVKITCNDMLGRVVMNISAGFGYGNDIFQTTSYDRLGRTKKVSEPFLNSDYSYQSNQATTYCSSSPSYCTVYGYDVMNRVTSKTDAKGVNAIYAYETGGNTLTTQTTVTPPDHAPVTNTTTLVVHNSLNKMLSTTDTKGSVTSFEYDADGNPVVIQDAAGHQTLASYNILDQKTQVVDPDQGTSNFTYDVLGELLTQTDAKTQQISMTYDSLGRMLTKTQPEGESIWCYDGATWTPGTLPNPGSCGAPTNGIATGKLSTVSQYDGYHESYTYNSDGFVATTDENIRGTDYKTATTYDSVGRVSQVTYPSTIADAAPTVAIGPNQTVPPNTLVTLTGAGSADTDSTSTSPLTYSWTQTSGPTVTITNPTSVNATFTTGAAGTTYAFSLLVSDGLQSATASVTVTVPPLPAAPGTPGMGASPNTTGTYTVSWAGVSVPGQTPTYYLEEATGTASGPTSGFTQIWSCTPSGTQTCTSRAVNHSNNAAYYYWYRVRAQDISGYGPYSTQSVIHVVVTPSPTPTLSPGGITVVTVNNSYTESWTTAGPKVTAYDLQESKNDNTFSSPATVYSGTGTSWSTTKTVASNDFYYRVQACNSNGGYSTCSAWSNTSHITINGTGGCGTCSSVSTGTTSTSPIPAPTSGTTAAPAPASGTSPVSMITPEMSSEEVAEAAPTDSQSGPRYAPPVYQAYADAEVMPVTGTRPIVGLTVQYNYNADGYLKSISNAMDPNTIYWKAIGANARVQITDEAFGLYNGTAAATSHRDYYPESGYAENIQTGPGAATSGLQNLHYDWQELGNLKDRNDLTKNLTEGFTYDALNRLTQAQVSNGSVSQPAVTYSYDALGNITCKSDVVGSACTPTSQNYIYGGPGPHAVTSTTNGYSYGYDLDGNMNNRNGTTIGWDSDSQPTSISQDANNSSQFFYAPDKHRYYQTALVNGQTETTVYAGAVEIVTDNNGTHNRYNLSAYGKAVAIVDLESDSNGNPVINDQYLLTDHLGSVDEAVDATGTLIAGTGWSFEAFGNRRDPGTWQTPASGTQVSMDRTGATSNGMATPSGVTHRGFTGHEMLDNVGLIHMNGRVYDPNLGRFLSVDPVFAFPTNTQSLNPYSYVLNNPLSMTDPSGYCAATSNDLDKNNTTICGAPGQNDSGETTGTGTHIKGNQDAFTSCTGHCNLASDGNGAQNGQNSTDAQKRPASPSEINSPSTVAKAAAASSCAYGESSCKLPDGVQAASADWLKQNNIKQSDLQDNKSGFSASIYIDSTTGQVFVAFRGTMNVAGDKTDAENAAGQVTTQYKEATNLGAIVAHNVSGPVIFTGHSLGGGLASVAALRANMPAITFNAAGVSPGVLRGLGLSANATTANRLIQAYHVANEPITRWQSYGIGSPALGTPHVLAPTLWDATKSLIDPFAIHSIQAVQDALPGGN